VGVVTLPQTLDKTVLAVFEVQFDSDNCPVGLVELDHVFAPDTGIPGVFAFAQYGRVSEAERGPNRNDRLTIVLAYGSWNIPNLVGFGTTSRIAFYDFNTHSNTLEEKDNVEVPAYPQAVGYCPRQGLVFVPLLATVENTDDPSARFLPRLAYPNNAVDKESSLQIFYYNERTGEAEYVGGIDTDHDFLQAQPDPDCDYLLASAPSEFQNSVEFDPTNTFSGTGREFVPTTAVLYRIKGARRFTRLEMEDIHSGMPYSFGIAWNSKSDRAVLAGVTTFETFAGFTAGSNGVLYFDVDRN
jgi:hypothetical protein